MSIENNTASLQALLEKANSLSDAGSGSGEDLDAELTTQDTLIANIMTALEGKAAGGGGASVETCTVTISGGAFNFIGATVKNPDTDVRCYK